MRASTVVVVTGALLTSLATGGCQGGGSTKDVSTIATPDEFAAALAVAFCGYDARCGNIAASEQRACEADVQAARARYPEAYSLAEAVAARRVAFDGKAARACVDVWKTAGCTLDALFASASACDGVYQGQVAVGEACSGSGECVDRAYCDQGDGSDGCPGTCVAAQTTGESCADASDPPCARTDYCRRAGDRATCETRVGSGEECGFGDQPRCQRGLFCHGYLAGSGGQPDTPGTCGPGGKVGNPCIIFLFGDTDCSPELWCDDSDSTSYVCASRLDAGAECRGADACKDGLACLGLIYERGEVVQNGTCGKWLEVGAACDGTVSITGCPNSLTCEGGVCALDGIVGNDCSSDGYCRANHHCDDGGLCQEQVPFGGSCTPADPDSDGEDPCNDGSCEGGKCALVCG